MTIKEGLIDNIDFIKNEYEDYIREEVYSEYLHTQRAQDIMYEYGDLAKDFEEYYTLDLRDEMEKTIHEGQIVYLALYKIRITNDTNKLIEVFSIMEDLAKENDLYEEIIFTFFVESLIRTKEEIDKYFKLLGPKLVEGLIWVVTVWKEEHLLNYVNSIVKNMNIK